jgi:hypothetical protein
VQFRGTVEKMIRIHLPAPISMSFLLWFMLLFPWMSWSLAPRSARAEPPGAANDMNGIEVRAARPDERRWVASLRRLLQSADGGGAGAGDSLVAIQTEYGPQEGNVALLLWDDPQDVVIAVDDEPVANVAPGINLAFISPLEPGLHAFRVVGATVAEGSLTILEAQPFSDAMEFRCEQGAVTEESSCDVVFSWTNPGPLPSYYLLLVDDNTDVETSDGEVTEVVVQGLEAGAHAGTLYGFGEETPGNRRALYRGAAVGTECDVTCQPAAGNAFIRGACNGQDTDSLASAVFALGYLFLGGPAPPCLAACDTDANGEFDLSDPVYFLNYLFLGGLPPAGWVDHDGDATPDPTCESAPPEECATSHSACS